MAELFEIEIKLAIPGGAAEALRLIERLGAIEQTPRTLQIDQVFDRADGALGASRELLRLRSEGQRSILTYKGPPLPGRHKRREELETPVSDGPALAAILQSLEFVPTFRYEKFRTTFSEPGEPGLLAMDETPIGVFLELEGPEDWIDRCALRLGFAPTQYVTASYASLYRQYLANNSGTPNMTF